MVRGGQNDGDADGSEGPVSSPEWKIVNIGELHFTFKELRVLGDDVVAYFSLCSYAATELNVIARTLISSFHKLERDTEVNLAAVIQQGVITRLWVLKLFEFRAMLDEVAKDHAARKNTELAKCVESAKTTFADLSSDPAYYLARDIRHEASAHYKFGATRKNLAYIKDAASASMYAHEMNGNSFYPLGEEVVFIGRVNRGRKSSTLAGETNLSQLDALFEWSKLANRWVHRVHAEAFRNLILPHFPEKRARRRTFWVSPEKVGSRKDFNIPLFGAADLKQQS